jgi:hypothetical protein
MEKLLRERAAREMLGNVGATKFRAQYRPRLQVVRLSSKVITFTQSSVQALIEELIAESGNVPAYDPQPNKLRREGRTPSKRGRR